MSPVPRTVPIIAIVMGMSPVPMRVSVVSRAHHHRRGVDDGRRWGDDDRDPDTHGHMHPRLSGQRQCNDRETYSGSNGKHAQQRFGVFHCCILLF